jgi:hypothetical protein
VAALLALTVAGVARYQAVANAGDGTPWEPGVITDPVVEVQFLRYKQSRIGAEMQAKLLTHETDVERAAVIEMNQTAQTFMENRIDAICADLDPEEAIAAGC